ncbi:MAG: DNA replication and repair protein RecF, partial [Clostridiales bacterium]|nr:DNA replication and repair protein RecF [Clostridiales bacterium]
AHGEAPLLLLDDVLSELDERRRGRLLIMLDRKQTLMTCTDLAGLKDVSPACVLTVREDMVSDA